MKEISFKEKYLGKIGLYIAVLFLCLNPNLSYAQNVSFEATVETNKVELGSSLQLALTIKGSKKPSKPFQLPEMEGFESKYLDKSSTHISFINGVYSLSNSFVYELYPLKTGRFQIPSFKTTISGKEYATQPIDIEVLDAGTVSSNKQNQSDTPVPLNDRIFVSLSASKNQVYLNEKVPITIDVFSNELTIQNIQYPEFEHIGFSVGDYKEPNRYQRVINGVQYDVVRFETSVYPTRAGDLSLGPATLACSLLFKQSSSKNLGSIFGDDFFDGFFETYNTRTITLESADEVSIKVLPLPEEGKPKDFSGAVGQFDFDVSVSPKELKEGDPITLKIKVSGEGNLDAITMPSLKENETFETYNPEIDTENGAKTLKQVVIPKTDKVKEFPAIKFAYFDEKKQQYQTITEGPFPITVQKLSEEEQLKVVGFGEEKVLVLEEKFGRDIVFIKDAAGKFQARKSYFYRSPKFIVLVVASFIAWLGLLIWYRIIHRLRTDIVYARKLHAPKRAKKELALAEKYLQKEQQKEFYNAILKTLQEYFGNKFHLVSATITFETIEESLKSKGINQEVIGSVKSIFAECDLVRYASLSLDNEKMEDNYQKTREIIDYLERRL